MRTARKAIKVHEQFWDYMRVRRYALEIGSDDSPVPQAASVNVLSGPGHNVASAAVLLMHDDGKLEMVFKAGDTRPARVLRGEPYVKLGCVSGRLDKEGVDAADIAKQEIAEEVGAELVDGGFLPLGERAVPTMPSESTEADYYFLAISRFVSGKRPTTDGSGMELSGLVQPRRMSVNDGLSALDTGTIGEAGRGRVMFCRALDRLGYIPLLDKYVFDLPSSLRDRYESLGLGDPIDLRKLGEVHRPLLPSVPHPDVGEINDVKLLDRVNMHLEEGALLVNARVAHAIRKDGDLRTVGKPFRIQFLHLPYDRVKVAVYAMDETQGPMVLMEPIERLAMAVKAMCLKDELGYEEPCSLTFMDLLEARMQVGIEHRRDRIEDLADSAAETILMSRGMGATPRRLGASVDASPGQSDLRYHFYSAEVGMDDIDGRFVPLSEAIASCRAGQGDASAEALLLRLADDLEWLPTLRMSREKAIELMEEK